MIEQGTEWISVKVSRELLTQLRDWSEPVQVRVGERYPDGTYDMIFRTVPSTPPKNWAGPQSGLW